MTVSPMAIRAVAVGTPKAENADGASGAAAAPRRDATQQAAAARMKFLLQRSETPEMPQHGRRGTSPEKSAI